MKKKFDFDLAFELSTLMSKPGDNQDSAADKEDLDRSCRLPAATRSRVKLSGGTLAGGLPPKTRSSKASIPTGHSDTDSDGF